MPAIALLVFAMTAVQTPANAPNVILILTDDQGYGDVSLHGNPVIETVHMDRLAQEGVRFEQFHVTAMCSPTRAALLTGRSSLENGVISTCQGLHTLREGFPTLPEALQAGGYTTGIFGKWHLGRNWPNRPVDRGFDENFVLYGFGTTGISSRWNNDYVETWVEHNGVEMQAPGFCTDAIFDAAMTWIDERAKAPEPFFAYISTNAPHFPFWAPEAWTEPFRDTDNPEFFAMLKNLDDNLGRLLAFLEERELAEDTIVMFLSDNGPVGGKSTFNAGMTGGKATPWEGGHRVPLFIRYPAGGLTDGRVVEGLADVTDLFPTLLALTGVDAPKTANLTGENLVPAMLGEGDIPTRTLVMQIQQHNLDPQMAAVMHGPWRILWADTLYNIEADLAQQNKVEREHPDVFVDLWSDYKSYYYEHRETASTPPGEIIGSPHQPVVVLDGSNWVGGPRGDGQQNVREATDRRTPPEGAPWKVLAHTAGEYRITLRRWPVESGLALDAGCPPFETRLSGKPLPAGRALPIDHATLDIDHQRFTASVEDDPTAITVIADLGQGAHRLHGIFRDAEGQPLCGSFYAYIEKL